MTLVIVGGNSRNVGKTSLACSILRATPELEWTAVKIAQFGHGMCTADGRPCDCAVYDPRHPYAISEEADRDGSTDTSRLLRAGASRVWWLRTPQGRLGEAVPALRRRLGEARAVLLESNSARDFFEPDLYVSLLDYGVEDFKPSAQRLLPRADAFALVGSAESGRWQGVDPALLEERPNFSVAPPDFSSDELLEFVRRRLSV